ncbi:MAG: hypothetical protein D6689_07060 [Deltaproteobacteria bacterium]|nr:MAG: hypothetical protein D6689_07060 [Deltaproteobacteria bacterium]
MRATVLIAAAVAAVAGCDDEFGPDIDPFPIPASRAGGPLTLGLRAGDVGPLPALVDTLSPVTLLDPSVPGEPVPAPRRLRATVEVVSAGPEPVARARFDAVPILEHHPCDPSASPCAVGTEPLVAGACPVDPGSDGVRFRAILGGDLLSQTALRVDLRGAGAAVIQLFPDIAGADAHHCRAGDAVIAAALAGGSTIEIEGGEVPLPPTRIPLRACADFDPANASRPSGTDLLLLLATGIGPTVVSESAYRRYAAQVDAACAAEPGLCAGPDARLDPPVPYELLPAACLRLPGVASVARVATLRRIAIVGRTAGEARGPCEERRAVWWMQQGGCAGGADCPCGGGDRRCRAAAAVQFEPGGGIPVAVVPDGHPLLQALRAELRPRQAEVDGLLGLDALRAVRLDIDYPGQRLVVRCAGGDAACTPFTQVFDPNDDTPAGRCPNVD